jgi:hypothetical protein
MTWSEPWWHDEETLNVSFSQVLLISCLLTDLAASLEESQFAVMVYIWSWHDESAKTLCRIKFFLKIAVSNLPTTQAVWEVHKSTHEVVCTSHQYKYFFLGDERVHFWAPSAKSWSPRSKVCISRSLICHNTITCFTAAAVPYWLYPFHRTLGFIFRFLTTQLISNNILANQQPVLGFAMPFTSLSILCKKAGPKPFCTAKTGMFWLFFFIQFSHTQYQIQIVCARVLINYIVI